MKNTGVDDYWDVAPEGKRIKKMRDSKEIRDVKSRRRVVAASLDLSYAFEEIAKKNKLRGWETVTVLQEAAFKQVSIMIGMLEKRDRKRKSARA